jgi:hypothetical protein
MLNLKNIKNSGSLGKFNYMDTVASPALPLPAKTAKAVANPARSLSWPWRYDTTKYGSRDVRLDLLRGLCFAAMTIDHMGIFGPDTWLYTITANGNFFISAAEGFVFISGLVMGLVYFKLIKREGIGAVVPKILGRVVKLYWLAVGISLFFVALATFTPLKLWADRDWITIKDPIELIVGTLTLHFAFHGGSIMVMYVIFVALTPLLFYLLNQGKTLSVLAVSLFVWGANVFYPNQFSLPFAANFPIASWQLLFVGGLLIGWHRESLVKLLSQRWQTVYALVIGGLALAGLAVFLLHKSGDLAQIFPALDEGWLWNDFNDKGRIPLARLAMIALYLQAFYLLATWFWQPIKTLVGWYLTPIGEKGMYTYTMHLLLIVLVYNLPYFLQLPYVLYGFAQLGALLLILLAVKTRFLAKLIPS